MERTVMLAVRMESHRRAVGGDQFLDFRFHQSLVGYIGENCVRNSGVDIFGAIFFEKRRGVCQGARGFGQVIHHDDVFAVHVADHS